MSDYFPKFEKNVGKPVANLIMRYVRSYKLTENHASEFARHLDEQLKDEDDQKAWGNFKQARNTNGYDYEEAFKCILSDWFRGFGVKETKKDTIRSIISALKDAKMKPLVSDIEELLEEEENKSVQTLGASARKQGKIIDGLPNTPEKILLQKPLAAGPPSSEPYPSQQHGPVCVSHAIGKAILKNLDLCNFDGNQDKIIAALIKEVQPNLVARYPGEFHGKTIMVNIEDREKKNHDVKLRVDVQTDFETVPNLPENYLTEKKIQRVIRDNTIAAPATHALYVKDFDGQNYNCINSWGHIDARPARNASVYAVDYIQITEID